MKYNLTVCGGTFDHLHKGHREFLRHCLSISKKLLIGLTSDKYVENKEERIESYKLRKEQLENFLHQENALNRVLIQPIDDIFIPKAWEKLPIETIIVTNDTISGAEEINSQRIEQGKLPLIINVFSTVISVNNGYISSSKIRNGEINREGRLYIDPLWLNKKLFITDQLRQELKKPFGELINDLHNICQSEAKSRRISKNGILRFAQDDRRSETSYLITVGDVTTKNFNILRLNQDISIIDFKVARKRKFSNLSELSFSGEEKIIKIDNPPGCLTPGLFKASSQVFKSRKESERIILQIDGEEDLSVLPLTLAAPLGSVIFYGQPDEGVVRVEVSEEMKMRAYYLVGSFEVSS